GPEICVAGIPAGQRQAAGRISPCRGDRPGPSENVLRGSVVARGISGQRPGQYQKRGRAEGRALGARATAATAGRGHQSGMTETSTVLEPESSAAPARDEHGGHGPGTTFSEYMESLLVTVILALFGTSFVVQAFKIPSSSMERTLLIGDHLLVNKFIFGGT